MNWRRIPVVATLVVLAAVAVMVKLGLWQLDRKIEKETLIARYSQVQAMSSLAELPSNRKQVDAALYRRATADCTKVLGYQAVSGRSERGAPGIVHVARCHLFDNTATWPEGEEPITDIDVAIGWSQSPASPNWQGGRVEGVLAPSKNLEGFRLIARTPTDPGLRASAAPDPREITNNHLAYAVQWFLFALTALVIYAIALRKRLAGASGGG